MSCDFVTIGDTQLPAVAGVQMVPVYITDSERTISGMLRTDHTAIARSWRVSLRGVPGDDLPGLLQTLQEPPAPRFARVMGVETLVEVRVDNVQFRPRIVSAHQDLGRADISLTLQEITPETVGGHEIFLASGTWDWAAAGSPDTVDVLLLGGGGGSASAAGSDDGGGGGGAGGLLIAYDVPVAGDVAVTVGAGNIGNGGNSVFGDLVAIGGGQGARVPQVGGSGGGSTGRNTAPTTPPGAAGTPGQGHAGGEGSWGGARTGGGGGGANGPGEDAGGSGGGNGGPGVVLAQIGWGYAGAPVAVAGGGGGGRGQGTGAGGQATHGGGNGGSLGVPGSPGLPNTGGGGGGGGNAAGGSGGSGLVIIRWRV